MRYAPGLDHAQTGDALPFGLPSRVCMWYTDEGGLTGDLLAQWLIVLFLDGNLPRG